MADEIAEADAFLAALEEEGIQEGGDEDRESDVHGDEESDGETLLTPGDIEPNTKQPNEFEHTCEDEQPWSDGENMSLENGSMVSEMFDGSDSACTPAKRQRSKESAMISPKE